MIFEKRRKKTLQICTVFCMFFPVTNQPTMKITRALLIATEIKNEIGGDLNTIRAKVAGIIFMNPDFTDEEVAAAFVINQ